MKKAAIIVGKQHSGKSTTIRELKSILGKEMDGFHRFKHIGKRGYILSTSFEEAGRDVEETINRLANYDLLVFACQGPKLSDVHRALKKSSFIAKDIMIDSPKKARDKAHEVVQFFNSNLFTV
jgi:hypothetical protein